MAPANPHLHYLLEYSRFLRLLVYGQVDFLMIMVAGISVS